MTLYLLFENYFHVIQISFHLVDIYCKEKGVGCLELDFQHTSPFCFPVSLSDFSAEVAFASWPRCCAMSRLELL